MGSATSTTAAFRATAATRSARTDGRQWANYHSQWNSPQPTCADLNSAKEAFCASINQANPGLLSAFLKAAAGFDGPIHYPRLPDQRAGSGEHFRWFGRNEDNARLSLPDLGDDDCSLPANPAD